jgi:hypothetical protein
MIHARGRIPATAVSGFLGAGETHLVRNLLRRARGRPETLGSQRRPRRTVPRGQALRADLKRRIM